MNNKCRTVIKYLLVDDGTLQHKLLLLLFQSLKKRIKILLLSTCPVSTTVVVEVVALWQFDFKLTQKINKVFRKKRARPLKVALKLNSMVEIKLALYSIIFLCSPCHTNRQKSNSNSPPKLNTKLN